MRRENLSNWAHDKVTGKRRDRRNNVTPRHNGGVTQQRYWVGLRGYVPLSRVGDVPLRRHWVFHLRLFWDVVETYHWDVLATFHRNVVGCFIWDVPATSLGRTERRRYDVATRSCCRVCKKFSLSLKSRLNKHLSLR